MDVISHALCDALFGCLADGDRQSFSALMQNGSRLISGLFSPQQPGGCRRQAGGFLNLDITLLCEQPKLGARCAAKMCGRELPNWRIFLARAGLGQGPPPPNSWAFRRAAGIGGHGPYRQQVPA